MPSLNDLCSRVRSVRLHNPRPQQPPLHVVLEAVISHTQNLYNELSNTNKAWATEEVPLTVQPNKETYLLPVDAQIGKVLSVVTSDPANPHHIERSIDFFDIQNLQHEWDWPNNIAVASTWNWDGSTHTAQRMAFFYKGEGENAGLWVKVKPIPQQAAVYQVLYTIGNWVESAGLGSSPILSGHHQLIEVRAARSVLPSSVWFDDEEKDFQKRKEVRVTLDSDEQIFAPAWDRYITTFRQHRMTYRGNPIEY
jgi:hypothetical protein